MAGNDATIRIDPVELGMLFDVTEQTYDRIVDTSSLDVTRFITHCGSSSCG